MEIHSPSAVSRMQELLDGLERELGGLPAGYRERFDQCLEALSEQGGSREQTRVLADERARFRAMFTNAPEAMVVTDEQARVLMTNPAADRLYARPVPYGEHFDSHTALELCYPGGIAYDPRDLPLTRSALDGETFQNVEMEIRWPDGQMRTLLVNTSPIMDEQGRVNGAVGVFQDISERKQRELDLVNARTRLDLALSGARLGVWSIAGPEDVVSADRAAMIMHGVPEDSPIPNLEKAVDLIHPEDREAVVRGYQSAWSGGGYYEVTYRVVLPDGKIRWITSAGKSNPALNRLDGVVQDITERMNAQMELKASEENHRTSRQQLEDILTSISDGVFELDTDWRFTYINEAAAKNSGIPRDAYIGRRIWDLMPWINGTQYEEIYRRAMETRQAEYAEIHSLVNDLWFGLTVSPSVNGITVYSRDITARKQVEQAVRESERHVRRVLNSLFTFVGVLDTNGLLLEANDAPLDAAGITLEDVVGKPFHEEYWWNYSPEVSARVREAVELAAQGGKTRFDIDARMSHGRLVTLDFMIAPMLDEQGRITHLIPSAVEITDRVRYERAVRESEERYRQLVNLIPDTIFVQVGGEFVFLNPAGAKLFGAQDPEEMLGRKVLDFIHPEDRESVAERIRKINEDRLAVKRVEERFLKLDGGAVPVEAVATPIAFEEQPGALVVVSDITEQRQTEAALRESQRRFEVAMTSVPLMVYTCDCDLRYTWIYNPLAGFTSDQVLGKRDDEVLSPAAAADLIAAKQHALDSGTDGVREVSITMDGQMRTYILTVDPLKDEDGQVTGLTCSALDITEQRRLQEEQLQTRMQMEVQRRLLEFREKERQEIAREIHDGPIQSIVSAIFNVQVAKEAVPDPMAQMEFSQIGVTLQSVVRELRTVVNELRPPSLIRFGLAKALRMHLEDFREKFPVLQIEEDLPEMEERMPEDVTLALFRVCQEALNNVTRHANARHVLVRFRREHDQALLIVQDDGSGFTDARDLLGQTRTGHYGLAGMKERAEAIGGRLSITSIPNQGVTVQVMVPLTG